MDRSYEQRVISTICGDFDYKRYRTLRKLYVAAAQMDKDEFVWEGNKMSVTFVHYLLEYLQPHFSTSKHEDHPSTDRAPVH